MEIQTPRGKKSKKRRGIGKKTLDQGADSATKVS